MICWAAWETTTRLQEIDPSYEPLPFRGWLRSFRALLAPLPLRSRTALQHALATFVVLWLLLVPRESVEIVGDVASAALLARQRLYLMTGDSRFIAVTHSIEMMDMVL